MSEDAREEAEELIYKDYPDVTDLVKAVAAALEARGRAALEEAAKAIDNVPASNGRGDGGWEYGLAKAAELVRSLKALEQPGEKREGGSYFGPCGKGGS